jgi:hypothetical protein
MATRSNQPSKNEVMITIFIEKRAIGTQLCADVYLDQARTEPPPSNWTFTTDSQQFMGP